MAAAPTRTVVELRVPVVFLPVIVVLKEVGASRLDRQTVYMVVSAGIRQLLAELNLWRLDKPTTIYQPSAP